MISTGLTRARRFQAALALDPLPASKVQSGPLKMQNLTSTTGCEVAYAPDVSLSDYSR